MAKVTLNDPATLDNSILALITANNTAIEQAMEKTLSRDGTSPNTMSADLDMNGNQILNLPEALDPTDPVRLGELEDMLDGLTGALPTGGTTGQVLAKASDTTGDVEWITASGLGTVTSVSQTVPTGFAVAGSPVTTSGTLAITYASGYQGYTTAEATKLSGIEALADVTDTANVTAAGALMDSEVTNLAAVKAFDPTAYATAAQGATADTAIQPADIGVSVQGYDADLASWAGVTRASGFDTFAATPSSANLRSLLTDETGTGSAVFSTSPTFTNAAAGNTVAAATFNTTTDAAFCKAIEFGLLSATPAANDQVYASFNLYDSGNNITEFGRVGARSATLTDGAEDGELIFSVPTAGTMGAEVRINGTATFPHANDGNALGTAANSWADLFLASGAVINFNNSDAVITHSTGVINVSTGVLQVGGALTKLVGKETIWIPANAMIARTTNGAAAGTAEMTTNKNMFKTLDFDTTTQEFAQFRIHMPKSWNLGTITFQPVWSHASTTTNFGVVWALQAVAISDDDAGDVAFGTEQTSTDTGGTTNDIYVGPESSAITIAGTPAAGDTVQFQLKRNVSDGSDTMAIDARLHGIRVFYTTNASTDA